MSDPRFSFAHCAGPLPKPAGTSRFRIKGEFYRHLKELVDHAESRGSRFAELLEAEQLTSFARQKFLASDFYDCLPFPRIVMAAARVLDEDVREPQIGPLALEPAPGSPRSPRVSAGTGTTPCRLACDGARADPSGSEPARLWATRCRPPRDIVGCAVPFSGSRQRVGARHLVGGCLLGGGIGLTRAATRPLFR